MPDQTINRRILRHVDVTQAPRAISPPATIDDPAVLALVEQEASRAYARGMQEGEARGRAEAEAAATALAASIQHALQASTAASAGIVDELAGRVVALSVEVAAAVVGELDPSENGMVARVEQALRFIDDRPLTVAVHPDDVAALGGVTPPSVAVAGDPTLQRGEARVSGDWADADLTWQAIWASVREVLDAE